MFTLSQVGRWLRTVVCLVDCTVYASIGVRGVVLSHDAPDHDTSDHLWRISIDRCIRPFTMYQGCVQSCGITVVVPYICVGAQGGVPPSRRIRLRCIRHYLWCINHEMYQTIHNTSVIMCIIRHYDAWTMIHRTIHDASSMMHQAIRDAPTMMHHTIHHASSMMHRSDHPRRFRHQTIHDASDNPWSMNQVTDDVSTVHDASTMMHQIIHDESQPWYIRPSMTPESWCASWRCLSVCMGKRRGPKKYSAIKCHAFICRLY